MACGVWIKLACFPKQEYAHPMNLTTDSAVSITLTPGPSSYGEAGWIISATFADGQDVCNWVGDTNELLAAVNALTAGEY